MKSLLLAICLPPLVLVGASSVAVAKSRPTAKETALAIYDDQGRTLVLRGINLGKKSPPYVPDVTDEDFERIASWGFNTVRFLILWAAIEPEPGVYDETYFDRVLPYLDMAYEHDLHVILDMHQDVYGEMFNRDGAPDWACPAQLTEGFENRPAWFLDYFSRQVMACFSLFWESEALQDHFIEAWRLAAEHLGAHPAVLGFDTFNEPYPGFNWTVNFEPDQLQPFYERLIPVLRQEAPDAYVFFEPWVFRDYFVPTYLTPMPFERLVYFPHYYNLPMELSATYPNQYDLVERWVTSVKREALELGVPFAVGEYGGNTQGEGIETLLKDFSAALDAANTGGMYWEYGKEDGGFVILNADGSEKDWIIDAVCRAYPRRVAGTLSGYQFNPDKTRLDVQYIRDASIPGDTELVAPSRLYPNGPLISVSDTATMAASWVPDRGVVVIQDDGPDLRSRAVTLIAR